MTSFLQKGNCVILIIVVIVVAHGGSIVLVVGDERHYTWYCRGADLLQSRREFARREDSFVIADVGATF